MLTSPGEVPGPPASPPADVDTSSERGRGFSSPATGPSPVQDVPERRQPAGRIHPQSAGGEVRDGGDLDLVRQR